MVPAAVVAGACDGIRAARIVRHLEIQSGYRAPAQRPARARQTHSRNASTRWVSSAVAALLYDGSELSAK